MSSPPDVKIIAISNVYCRNMHFKKTGDVEEGHCHTYDHGTLIATGKALIEMLDDNYNVIGSKEFEGPSLAFINKNRLHRITALKDDTVCVCIHAMRDIEGNILSPDFLIQEKWFADKWEDSDNLNDHYTMYGAIKRKILLDKITISLEERDVKQGIKK